jgi:O-antigen ligase
VALFALLVFTTITVFVRDAWPLESFQIGIYALLAASVLSRIRKKNERIASGVIPSLVYFIPLWGLLQIFAHTTASTVETRSAVLKWGALAAVFYLSQVIGRTAQARRNLLSAFLWFATLMAALCMTTLYTSAGRVLWLFPTGYPIAFATFQYHANYAQFIELALPIALWRALQEGWQSWWYAPAGGILYASVIGSASSAGTLICTAELLAMLVIGLIKLRDPESGGRTRSTTAILVVIPIVAALFTVVVGWQNVWTHIRAGDEGDIGRREFPLAALDMAMHRPLTGYGLGTFPEVYQRYAVRDLELYVNHAHNDWAEFAADGGFPFLLLVLIPTAAAVPIAIRHPWGLGLIAVMLHACVDYPFPRPAVSGWIFLVLALLYMTRTSSLSMPRSVSSLKRERPSPARPV